MNSRKTILFLTVSTYLAVGGLATLPAQPLPEVAVERSRGLCAAGHKLNPVVKEIERAARVHQMGGGGGGTTDPNTLAEGDGLRNVD